MRDTSGPDPDGFAGELFLTLAAEGRLVVEAGQADELIEGMRRVQSLVQARLRAVEQWQAPVRSSAAELPEGAPQELVDAVFAEQIAPGRLQRAADEIPKYIAALTMARRPRAGSKGTALKGLVPDEG